MQVFSLCEEPEVSQQGPGQTYLCSKENLSEPLSVWPLGEQPVPVLVALRQEQRSQTPKEPLSLPFMSATCAAANR